MPPPITQVTERRMHPIDGSHETLPRPFHNLFARLGKERRPVIEIPGARDPSNPSKLALSPWRVRGCGTGGPRRRVINFWTVGRTRTRIHMRGGRRENGRGARFTRHSRTHATRHDSRGRGRRACVRACVRRLCGCHGVATCLARYAPIASPERKRGKRNERPALSKDKGGNSPRQIIEWPDTAIPSTSFRLFLLPPICFSLSFIYTQVCVFSFI